MRTFTVGLLLCAFSCSTAAACTDRFTPESDLGGSVLEFLTAREGEPNVRWTVRNGETTMYRSDCGGSPVYCSLSPVAPTDGDDIHYMEHNGDLIVVLPDVINRPAMQVFVPYCRIE